MAAQTVSMPKTRLGFAITLDVSLPEPQMRLMIRRDCSRRSSGYTRGIVRLFDLMRAPALAALSLLVGLRPASALSAQAVRTGDRNDGTPMIDRLDGGDFAPGQVHRFWFRISDNAIGQAWYVPVVVVKGARPGHQLLLTAGIEGDELNGIDVILKLVRTIDPAQLSGTIVTVPGLNTPGLLHHSRPFALGEGADGANLNWLMPGDVTSSARASLYAGRL